MTGCQERHDLVADYFDVFNDEVRQFFDPFAGSNRDLRGSHIHINSRVKRLQADEMRREIEPEPESQEISDTDDENAYETAEEYENEIKDKKDEEEQLGSFWSAPEKTIFFHCVSRYSIHRIDEWQSQLPSKSKFEIQVYYQVLKKNLELLKRSTMKKFGGILSRAELPIAYEMEEFFVSFEETMAQRVKTETDKMPAADSQSLEFPISFESWRKRWLPIYSRSRIEELLPMSKEPIPFSKEAMDFMAKCCREYTKKILTRAVLMDLERISVPTSLFREQEGESEASKENRGDQDLTINNGGSSSQFPLIVTKRSILKAVSLLKQEGFAAPTLAETVLQTLNKFQLEHQEDGKLFKTKDVAMSLVPTLVKNAQVASTFAFMNEESESHQDEMDLVIAKKLFKLNGGKDNRKRRRISTSEVNIYQFPSDDELNRIDNPLELQLCDWETELLDVADLEKSRTYQHTLLNYFSGETPSTNYIESKEIRPQCPIPLLSVHLINRFLHTNT